MTTTNSTMRELAIENLRKNSRQLAAAEHDGYRYTIVQVYDDGSITIHKAASSSEQSILALEGKSQVVKIYGGFGSCSCDICSSSEDGKYHAENDESFDDASDAVIESLNKIETGFFTDEQE